MRVPWWFLTFLAGLTLCLIYDAIIGQYGLSTNTPDGWAGFILGLLLMALWGAARNLFGGK